METPKNVTNFMRNSSRLSERKKNLFSSSNEIKEDVMVGIVPLQVVELDHEPNEQNFNILPVSGFYSKSSSSDEPITKEFMSKEKLHSGGNTTTRNQAEQLEHMFNCSMKLKENYDNKIQDFSKENILAADGQEETRLGCKRLANTSENFIRSPKKRVTNEANFTLPSGISTKTFYSNSHTASQCNNSHSLQLLKTSIKARKNDHIRRKILINKSVSHKIRRRIKHNETGKSTVYSPVDIDCIVSRIRNDKLRSLLISRRQHENQMELISKISNSDEVPVLNNRSKLNEKTCNRKSLATFRESKSPDFSDLESIDSDDESDDADVDQNNKIKSSLNTSSQEKGTCTSAESNCNPTRKFFKSGNAINCKKEVRIAFNIKAEICNGKLSWVNLKKPKKRKFKVKNLENNEFSAEQAKVDAILQKLNDSCFGEITTLTNSNYEQTCNIKTNTLNEINLQKLNGENCYAAFRNRIPYNTTDPEVIEQQHLLLDFLINNNICTEENFNIFIADPDNHKEEAASIVDQMVVVINGEELNYDGNCNLIVNNECVINEEDCKTNLLPENVYYEVPETVEKTVVPAVEKLADNQNINVKQEIISPTVELTDTANSRELFPVFYTRKWRPLPQNSRRRVLRIPKMGYGVNQYQIDAGQKNFGVKQCKQCGLMYSAHEPEEEKLHRDYHESVHILRFRGWADEDVVAVHSDWEGNGRIIRISNNSRTKQKERLEEILNIVDKELGFSSYIIPQIFVAYLALCKFQIVGVCLVHPLQKAYKYLYVNNVDCCSEEEFEAKCGISRIWVSPHFRRMSIASKLIKAVQLHTILGEEIQLSKMAFSAPTEDGKQFAKKITQMEDFLVYF